MRLQVKKRISSCGNLRPTCFLASYVVLCAHFTSKCISALEIQKLLKFPSQAVHPDYHSDIEAIQQLSLAVELQGLELSQHYHQLLGGPEEEESQTTGRPSSLVDLA